MTSIWIPKAERVRGRHSGGGSMAGGVPRCTEHITWDKLSRQGARPRFESTRDYLVDMGFEPTLMVDPFTGRIAQFLPANRSAYALQNHSGGVETNRLGTAHIQVEWFFSPGCVVDHKIYADLTHTPMRGLEEVLALCESFGIPSVWAVGEPTWKSSPRSVATWLRRAGHYGHSQVPENSHGDPGPMHLTVTKPAVKTTPKPTTQPASKPSPVPTPTVQEDEMYAVVSDPAGSGDYGTNGVTKFHFTTQEAKNDWAVKFGAKRIELGAEAFADIPTVKSVA